jgi:vacuolar-type H+-ATPase subunit C/Vma6
MVRGGSLTKSQLEKIAIAKDAGDAASIAGQYILSDKGEFQKAQVAYKSDGQLSHFEVAFEKYLAEKSLHALRRSTMSIGAIIGFLLLKEEEASNIRKIVRGKALGLPPERISEMLVTLG